MKRILVFSDSHNYSRDMIDITLKVRPDMIIHLGDCVSDARELQRAYPEIPVEYVPGNCDFSQEIGVRILQIEKCKVMICHGHQYHVKEGISQLLRAGQEHEADVVLFGHTHKLYYDYHNGMAIMNPGSISRPYVFNTESYGLLKIDGSKATIETFYSKDIL